MESKKLTILCSSMDSQGHVNAILGFAKILQKRGHNVIVTLSPGWRSQVEKHGFSFIPLEGDSTSLTNGQNGTKKEEKGSKGKIGESKDTNGTDKSEDDNNPTTNGGEKESQSANHDLIKLVNKMKVDFGVPPMELVRRVDENFALKFIPWYSQLFSLDEMLPKVVEKVKPDMIIVDTMTKLPSLEKGTIPWAALWSANPIRLYHGHCPPLLTGFPTDSPKELWSEYLELRAIKYKDIDDHINSWLVKNGAEPYRKYEPTVSSQSQWINFYNFPAFLDYSDVAPKLHKWVRLDTPIRKPDDSNPFKLPECLEGKPGGLIYFSLGTMGSVDLNLMQRVLNVCAKSPNRFIVSKGPLADQIALHENMWGEPYLNQIAILPHCDLVITHGGNNTVTESLYFGKPMIVLPLFFDQLDNAQRVKEKGLGVRLDYNFKDEELLQAIEKLIADEPLKEKLSRISLELKNSSTDEIACQWIEKTVALGRSPFDPVPKKLNGNINGNLKTKSSICNIF